MGESREQRIARTEADMKLFGELPDDYNQFVEYHVFMRTHRMIFNNDINEAYCTACHTTHKISDLKKKGIKTIHKKTVLCPCCGRYSIAYNDKYWCSKEDDVRWSIYLEIKDDKLLINYVRSIKKYIDYKNPKIKTTVMGRTVIDIKRKDHCYERDSYAGEWHNYRYASYLAPKGIHKEPFNPVLYNDNISENIKGTPFEYSALDIISEQNKRISEDDILYDYSKPIMKMTYVFENHINAWKGSRYLEKLLKCKLFDLYDEIVHRYGGYKDNPKWINAGGNNISEILKLSKGAYKLFSKGVTNYHTLVKYQTLERAGVVINDKIASLINLLPTGISINEDMLKTMLKYVSAETLLRYMTSSKYDEYHYPDYISMAETLGYNLNDKYVRFPNNIKKAHDLAVGEFNRSKKNKANVKLRKLIKEGIYDFEYKGICIVVPKCTGDIIKEGQRQHHCVGTYVDEVCKGKTMILFVRMKDKLDDNFYTMEWKDGIIVQCRGFKNADMTEEVNEFCKKFTNEMSKRLSTSKAA